MANRVGWAERLVDELESLDSLEWRRLFAHPKSVLFLNEYLTAKCLTDYWTYRTYGIYWPARAHYDDPIYKVTADYLQNWRRPDGTTIRIKTFIAAREFRKTQDVAGFDTWMLARDTNTRLLIRAYTDPKAFEICGVVRKILESEPFTKRFPWVKPAAKTTGTPFRWKEDRLLLEREDMVRTPTVEACGIDSDPTGGHFHVRHADDMEVKNNAFSEILLKKAIQTFKNDANLMMAGSRTILCGTPWVQNGLINGILQGKGDFEDHDFDVFAMPAEVKVFDKPFTGAEPMLLPDRLTLRCAGAGFPTSEADLIGCQAKVTFYNPAVKDTVVEIREVVYNDGEHFRVNRPFPELLGQPLQWIVGAEKPSARNVWTLDSTDWLPPSSDTYSIPRKSLVAAKREQGSLDYSCQMLLSPVDPESLVFKEADIDFFDRDQMPGQGIFRWYRATDFATSVKSASSTAILTGFLHTGVDGRFTGLWITHMVHENQMQPLDIMLELFLGVLRIRDVKGELISTFHESGLIERTILNRQDINDAQKDPYRYFYARDGKYKQAAESLLAGEGSIFLRLHEITRGGAASKSARIAAMQPFIEAKLLHVYAGDKHLDPFLEQINTFTMGNDGMFDLLDALADIIREGRAPRPIEPKKPMLSYFKRSQIKAQNALLLGRSVRMWP